MNFLEYYKQTESFKIPDLLLKDLLTDPTGVFEAYLAQSPDLSFDGLLKDFQLNDASRDTLKQDFTPPEIAKLSALLLPENFSSAVDLCSGTGSLVVQLWNRCPDAYFHCEEFSERTIPFLLFNLSVRNIQGEVLCGDSLTQEYKAIYKLTKGDKFSSIDVVQSVEPRKFNVLISNPPYSLKWNEDQRDCYRFGIAPKKAADYAFVQYGISLLNDTGTACFILPHGVLFRGNSEGKIRQGLVDASLFNAVIGLPANCFLCTSIPVACLVFKPNSQDLMVIDASAEFSKQGKINRLENIDKILNAYRNRLTEDKFSHLVNLDEIVRNDYNLNIPRYVDKFEYVEPPPLADTLQELLQIEREIEKTSADLSSMVATLTGFSPKEKELVNRWKMYHTSTGVITSEV